MTVTVNGKEEQVNQGISILEFLKSKEIDPNAVVVEHNLNILEKEDLAAVLLQENDTLEVLKFVGGG